jgi:hypothetical protein
MRGSVHSSQFRKKRGTTHVMMNSIDVSLNYSCEKFVEREKKREKIHDQTNSASWTQPSLSPSKNPVEQY